MLDEYEGGRAAKTSGGAGSVSLFLCIPCGINVTSNISYTVCKLHFQDVCLKRRECPLVRQRLKGLGRKTSTLCIEVEKKKMQK